MKAKLNEIKLLLEQKLFNCQILASTETVPIEQLAVKLANDIKDRDQFLVIRAVNQDLSSQDALLGIASPPRNYQELQFIVTLPFFVIDEKITDISRLLLLLNKGIELPGFELSEVDRLIYYKHAFVVPEDDLDERILLSLVGMIQLLLDAFTDIIEAVATGPLSFQKVVENAQKLLKTQNKNKEGKVSSVK
jgi:hypothetical protein